MKVIYCDNNELFDILTENGVVMTCNENMEITISDEDAARIPGIVEQFAPAAFMDYSINNLS